MLAFFIYLVGIVETLGSTLAFFGVVGSMAFVVAYVTKIGYECGYNVSSEARDWSRRFFKFTCFGPVLLLLATLVPNRETLVAMYVIPAVASNEQVKEMPSQLLELGGAWLDKQINELKQETLNNATKK